MNKKRVVNEKYFNVLTIAMSTFFTYTGAAWGAASSNPWAKTSVANKCSLNDVMSEQLAQELQESDERDALRQ